MLHAFDAVTLKLLWRSQEGTLFTSGKYNEPLIARDCVFVGDRIQAFGLRKPGQKSPSRAFASSSIAPPGNPQPKEPVNPGRDLYLTGGACAVCHGVNGEGSGRRYSPLAGSEWRSPVWRDRWYASSCMDCEGRLQFQVNNMMEPSCLASGRLPSHLLAGTMRKIAQVLTYIRQAWGNSADPVAAETVGHIRQKYGDRDPWTQDEWLKIQR